jgi:P27 family predicted phage terminase small subunit
MARPRKPMHLLAPSAFGKNRNRNEAAGRFNQAQYPVLLLDEPPTALVHDEVARRYWVDLAPMLNQHRVMTLGDVNSFVTYCRVLADIERDEHAVMLEGRTHMGDDGVIRKHPLISVIAENRRMSNVLAQQFGLTPASRTKASPVPVNEQSVNEFADD